MTVRVSSRTTITYNPEWVATKNMLEGVALKQRRKRSIVEFHMVDFKKQLLKAVKHLKKLMDKNIYSQDKGYARLVDGKKKENYRTKKLRQGVRVIGPTKISENEAEGRFFDLRGKNAHRYGKYYDMLEIGTRPFVLTRRQQVAYMILLKKMGRYDKGLAKQFAKINKIGQGSTGINFGIKPMRMFADVNAKLEEGIRLTQLNLFERWLMYAAPAHRKWVIKTDLAGRIVSGR